MQSRIYRFEIQRALVNAVFEALDPATGEAVILYEWTPDVDVRESAKQQVEELLPSLQAEIFTADASLYLAAPTREAGAALLSQLQQYQLFTGAWENAPTQLLASAPPPIVLVQEPVSYQPVPLRPEWNQVATPPKKRGGLGCFFAFVGLIVFAVVWSASDSFVTAVFVLIVVWIIMASLLKANAKKQAVRR